MEAESGGLELAQVRWLGWMERAWLVGRVSTCVAVLVVAEVVFDWWAFLPIVAVAAAVGPTMTWVAVRRRRREAPAMLVGVALVTGHPLRGRRALAGPQGIRVVSVADDRVQIEPLDRWEDDVVLLWTPGPVERHRIDLLVDGPGGQGRDWKRRAVRVRFLVRPGQAATRRR